MKSITDAKQGGVGALVRLRHQAGPSPRTETGERLYETVRWQSCTIKINKNSTICHIVSVYGFPGANEGGEEMELNEYFLENVFLEAASLGDVPVIIGGDFNKELENSPTLTEMVSSGRWSDAASLLATVNNTNPGDTYTTGIGTSRIDMLFMNPAATRIFKQCFVVDVPTRRYQTAQARGPSMRSVSLQTEFGRFGAYLVGKQLLIPRT